MKKETIICDIKDCKNEDAIEAVLQVIFMTNQTDGRPLKRPSINQFSIDSCRSCRSKIIEGWKLVGFGAQGHNTYELVEMEKVK